MNWHPGTDQEADQEVLMHHGNGFGGAYFGAQTTMLDGGHPRRETEFTKFIHKADVLSRRKFRAAHARGGVCTYLARTPTNVCSCFVVSGANVNCELEREVDLSR